MRSCGRLLVALTAVLAMQAGSYAQACTLTDRAVLLLLDASYSMLNRVAGGSTRFTAARNAIIATIDLFPDDGYLALRLYGSELSVGRMDCEDTRLAVPFTIAGIARASIKSALANTHARGLTPIAYSLIQAAADFTNATFERTIVLVSDGGESCNGDACATAALLHTQGFVINTVGFMTSGVPRAQLRCIAAASGGQYFDVPVATVLADQLSRALGECPVATLPPRTGDDEMMPA